MLGQPTYLNYITIKVFVNNVIMVNKENSIEKKNSMSIIFSNNKAILNRFQSLR